MKKFFSILIIASMCLGLLSPVAFATENHVHYNCGIADCTTSHTNSVSLSGHQPVNEPYLKLTQADVTADGTLILEPNKSYYLGEDIAISKAIGSFAAGSYNLCLNGYTITQNTEGEPVINNEFVTAHIYICDCQGNGKLIGNGASVIINKGNLNIYGGTITGGRSTKGGGIYSTGRVYLYGGSISGNTAIGNASMLNGGGGVYIESADFIMYGGSISNNTVSYSGSNQGYSLGGGVYVFGTKSGSPKSTLYLYNGEISNNIATCVDTTRSQNLGGGVFVYGEIVPDKTFVEINGGTISGNIAKKADGSVYGHGGGIYLYRGTLNISGGTITENLAANNGGGIYNSNYNNLLLKITGGTISKNSAAVGGGVFSSSTFDMTGGTISENSAESGGGLCIYYNTSLSGGNITGNTTKKSSGQGAGVMSYCNKLEIKGNVNITNNKNGEADSNVYLISNSSSSGYEMNKITIAGELTFENPISISTGSNVTNSIFTSGWNTYMQTKNYGDYFVSENPNYIISKVGNELLYTKVYPVTAITLNKYNSDLFIGKTDFLSATVSPSNATNKNVAWTSSDPTVATVSSNGGVTGINIGTATITATAKDGSNVSASCTVTVGYRVAFDKNDGQGYMEDVPANGDYVLPVCTITPPEGKQFKGWLLGENEYQPGDTIVVTESTVIKAIWENIPPVHTCNWSYLADGATITATCNGDNLCDSVANKQLTIIKPASTRYGDGNNANATLQDNITSLGGEATLPYISYQKKLDDTNYDIATTTAPATPGTYKANITVGGATASVEYTIGKAINTNNNFTNAIIISDITSTSFKVTVSAEDRNKNLEYAIEDDIDNKIYTDALLSIDGSFVVTVDEEYIGKNIEFHLREKETELTEACSGTYETIQMASLISGIVKDNEGSPIEGVTVSLYTDDLLITTLITGADGVYKFEIPGLSGNYTIKFSKDEATGSKDIVVDSSYTDSGDFVLDTGSIPLTYTVTINNGTGSGEYVQGTTVTITATAPENGKRFKEWTGAEELTFVTGNKNTETATFTMPAEAVNLTATYEDIPVTYTITFNANGGSVSPANVTTDESGKLTELPTPTRSGSYTFKGWYTASTGGEKVTLDKVYTEDTTLYAKWQSSQSSSGGGGGGGVTSYTIKFETNGGTTIKNVTVSSVKLSKPKDPAKEGYVFDGWYTDKALKTPYDFSKKVTKSFTLYAKWVEEEKPETDTSEKEEDKTETKIPEEKEETPKEDTPVQSEVWENPFSDVHENDWFYKDVEYAVKNGLFTGTSETTFNPSGIITRAMMVTVLYRAEGAPFADASIPFVDVDMNSYYADAVVWANKNGIIIGMSDTEFMPDFEITREQIATIMYRYAKYKGYDLSVGENINLQSYEDYNDIFEYAHLPMQYTAGSGLMKGRTNTTINPKDKAMRSEIATILHRFSNCVKYKGYDTGYPYANYQRLIY